ncbi:MAG: hypothetical protein CL933_11080 [Deltaproteobacteria bacterium]|nr:hypothetical protein [Deltaproteobacteria bacterium]
MAIWFDSDRQGIRRIRRRKRPLGDHEAAFDQAALTGDGVEYVSRAFGLIAAASMIRLSTRAVSDSGRIPFSFEALICLPSFGVWALDQQSLISLGSAAGFPWVW